MSCLRCILSRRIGSVAENNLENADVKSYSKRVSKPGLSPASYNTYFSTCLYMTFCKLLLNVGNGLTWVQVLRANLGTVHDRMTTI